MDVANDGQRLADRNNTDIMDQTLDVTQHDPAKVDKQAEMAIKAEVTEAPGPTEVLERPREGGDGAQQSSIQMRKTPTLTLSGPFSCRAWVDTRGLW